MDKIPQAYKDALSRRVHAVCLDRNLDSGSGLDTEAGCRIERFVPELIDMTRQIRAGLINDYEAALRDNICARCGNMMPDGVCPVRERAECCLYRYLALVIEAILDVEASTHPEE